MKAETARPTVFGPATDVGVLDKVMRILSVLERAPCSLAELTVETGFHRATAHRLATALEEHGMVRRNTDGRFALGTRLVTLGAAAGAGLPLREAARPILERLTAATGESTQLYLRQGAHRVCVESVESPHSLRTIVSLGAVLPLHLGSAGKVLSGELHAVEQQRGWVESVGEREAGVASVSAPVHDRLGNVVAAVSVSGPIERTTTSPGARYGVAVSEAARALEQASQASPASPSPASPSPASRTI